MAGLLALLGPAGPPAQDDARPRLGSASAPASRPRPASLFELPIDAESDPEVLVDFRVRQNLWERIALGVHVYGTIEETPRYRLVDGSGNVQFSDFDLTVFHLGLDFRYVSSDGPVSRSSRSAAAMSRARPKATTAGAAACGRLDRRGPGFQVSMSRTLRSACRASSPPASRNGRSARSSSRRGATTARLRGFEGFLTYRWRR